MSLSVTARLSTLPAIARSFIFYVIARLDRAIRLSLSQSAELNFPFFQNKIHCLFHQIKE